MQRNQSAAFSSGKVRPNHETNINIIARLTGKDVNSHTVLDGIITTIIFFNDTATTEIYTLSLHDALPISSTVNPFAVRRASPSSHSRRKRRLAVADRKSTRLNSSHANISYAVFCLKKKRKDVNSHTVLDGIITTIMATIQRINIIGSREVSRNRRRLKANQTGKKFRVGIKSNISTNRNNLISGVDRCIHLNAMKKTTITSINRQTIKI